MTTTTDADKLVREEIEQSERTRGEDAPDGGIRKNAGRGQVYSVRLPADVVAEVEALAAKLDVPASALVRGFVINGLAEREGLTLARGLNRIEADVRALRNLIQ